MSWRDFFGPAPGFTEGGTIGDAIFDCLVFLPVMAGGWIALLWFLKNIEVPRPLKAAVILLLLSASAVILLCIAQAVYWATIP